MSALDKLRDKLAMYESTPPDVVNTPGKPDSGVKNTQVNPASQTTAPLRNRLFTVTAKGKEQARRKLKEIQDAKLREVQTASTGFGGHTDSKFIAEESPTMSSCAAGETEVGVGMKEIEKLNSVQFNPNEGPEKSKLEVFRSTTDGKLISVSEKSCETKTDDPDEKHCVMIEGSLDKSPPTFRTARGKSIVIPDKVVAAAKAKFNEDSEHPMCMSPEPASMMSGITTASRKKIIVSEKAIKATRAKLCDEDLLVTSGGTNMASGFSTAAGNLVTVSKEAIEVARDKLCDEELQETPQTGNMMSGFTTASRKKITISDEAIKAAKAELCDEELPEIHERANIMSGLTTASNEHTYHDFSPPPGFGRFTAASARSHLNPSRHGNYCTLAPRTTNLAFAGPVRPSFNRAVEPELINIDCDDETQDNQEQDRIADEDGVISSETDSTSDSSIDSETTWNNKDLDAEKKAEIQNIMKQGGIEHLLNDGPIFNLDASSDKYNLCVHRISEYHGNSSDSDAEEIEREKDEAFLKKLHNCTFFEAGGLLIKAVWPSQNELKIGERKPIDSIKSGKLTNGLATDNRKKIAVSEEAIKAAKAKFCNEDSDIPPELANMSGFSTDGENLITVSDEAIKTAREKLSDEKLLETLEREHLTSGFSTAGGKIIKISEEAVNAARNLIHQDASIDVVNVGVVNLACLPEACGTAVSEDALIGDKNTMVFENQNEIVVVMAGQDCSLSKVETTDLKLEDPSPCDETINSDSEVAECTRILLEDIENSDAESDWTSPSDVEHNKKPKNSLACVPSFSGDVFPLLNVVVVRVYPIMYCTLGKDNKNCFMAEKAFAKRQMDKAAKEAELRESLISGVEAEVRKRFIKNEKINPKDLTPRALRRMSADELLHILNNCEEDAETISFVMGNLNITAKQDLERARTELSENIQRAVAEELAEKIKNTTEKVPNRVLKLRVMDQDSCNNSEVTTSGVITIWNAQDEIINNIREGKIYSFQFLKPAPFHAGQEIRLGSTKTTRISSVDGDIDMDVFKRKLSLIPDVIAKGFNPPFGEFDTVGVVMKVEQFKESNGQIVHLIEENGFVLKVKFWNDLYDWDLQDVLKPGKIVVCLNLQWQLTSAENTMAFAQEASDFTTNPMEEYLLNGVQHLSGGIETIKQLIGGEGQSSGESSTTTSTLLEESVEVSGVSTRYSTKRRYSERYGDSPPNSGYYTRSSVKRHRLDNVDIKSDVSVVLGRRSRKRPPSDVYGDPSELVAMPVASPTKRGRVSKKFVTPRRITPKN